MKIRGIFRGKTIELLEALPVPDGLEIFIEIPCRLGRGNETQHFYPIDVGSRWRSTQPTITTVAVA